MGRAKEAIGPRRPGNVLHTHRGSGPSVVYTNTASRQGSLPPSSTHNLEDQVCVGQGLSQRRLSLQLRPSITWEEGPSTGELPRAD